MCEVFAKKQAYINYRPRAHHKLFTQDHHFDSRFNAYLRCEQFVRSIYDKYACQSTNSQDIVKKLKYDTYKLESVISGSCLLTDLSDMDRDAYIYGIIPTLESQLSTVVLTTTQHPEQLFATSRDYLNQLIEAFKHKFYEYIASEKRRVRQTSDILKSTMDFLSSSSCAMSSSSSSIIIEQIPILYLDKLFKLYQQVTKTKLKFLTIVVYYTENFNADVLGQLLSTINNHLSSSSSSTSSSSSAKQNCNPIKIHFILFHSSSAIMNFHLSKECHIHLSHLFYHYTLPSSELYEQTLSRILITHEIPVTLSSQAIAWIHEHYWRSDHCVASATYRILLCLGYHFQSKCSILSMYEDTKWLEEMGLVKHTYSSTSSSSSSSASSAAVIGSGTTANNNSNTSNSDMQAITTSSSSSVLSSTHYRNIKEIMMYLSNDDLTHTNLLVLVPVLVPTTTVPTKSNSNTDVVASGIKRKLSISSTKQPSTIVITSSSTVKTKDTANNTNPAINPYLYAYNILTHSITYSKCIYVWFHILLLLRDTVLPSHRKTEFSCDMLYAALIVFNNNNNNNNNSMNKNHQGSLQCELLSDFMLAVSKNIAHTSFTALVTLMEQINHIIRDEVGIYINNNNSNSNNSNNVNNNNDNNNKSESAAVTLVLSNLSDLSEELLITKLMIMELIDRCYSCYSGSNNNNKNNHQTQIASIGGRSNGSAVGNTTASNALTLHQLQHRKIAKPKSVGSGDNRHSNINNNDPTTTASADVAIIVTQDDDDETVEEEASAAVLDLTAFAQNVIVDFTDCIVGAVERFYLHQQKLSSSGSSSSTTVPGVLQVDNTALQMAIERNNSNMRYKFSNAVLNPKTHFHQVSSSSISSTSSTSSSTTLSFHLPDTCIVMERIQDCVGTEHVYDWFDHFIDRQQTQTPWLTASSSSSSGGGGGSTTNGKNKRQKTVATVAPSTEQRDTNTNNNETADVLMIPVTSAMSEQELIQMKCRFANAVTDLQTCGMIKMKTCLAMNSGTLASGMNSNSSNSNNNIVNNNNNNNSNNINSINNASQQSRSMAVTRQCFSWMAE